MKLKYGLKEYLLVNSLMDILVLLMSGMEKENYGYR